MNEDLNVGELHVIEKGVPVHFTVAIHKDAIDVEKRTVRGLATQESVDLHGEEVDFDSVIKSMAFWRGNIREMHQPIAVGRAVDIVVREDIRGVEVESYISKGAESTWLKCLDGTLAYYSIGGIGDRVLGMRSDGTRGPRVYMTKWTELSLVDSGACDGSKISVVKLGDDGVPVAQLADDDAPNVEKATWTTAYMNDLPDSAFLYIEPGGKKDADGKTTPRSKRHFPVKDKDGNVDEAHVKNALSRIPQSDIPEKAKAATTKKAQRMLAALKKEKSVDGGERGEHGDDVERATASTRRDSEPNTSHVSTPQTPVEKAAFRSEAYDIDNALACFACLNRIITNESYEMWCRQCGSQCFGETMCPSCGAAIDPQQDNTAQISLLRMAAGILLDFLMSEFEQQFGTDECAMSKLVDTQRATVTKAIELRKTGARHSMRDLTMLQSVHDNAVSLGASCGEQNMKKTVATTVTAPTTETAAAAAAPSTTETAQPQSTAKSADVQPPASSESAAAAAAPVAAAAAPTDATPEKSAVTTLTLDVVTALVTKAVSDATTSLSTALAEQKATSDKTIAALQEQVAKLSSEPQNGGPVANANATAAHADSTMVEKALHGDIGAITEPEIAKSVIAALMDVGTKISNPAERQLIAEKCLALQLAHGIDARIVPVPSQR